MIALSIWCDGCRQRGFKTEFIETARAWGTLTVEDTLARAASDGWLISDRHTCPKCASAKTKPEHHHT